MTTEQITAIHSDQSSRTTEMDVVIVNYNTRELLRACLESLRNSDAASIVVVDNGSNDGSTEMVTNEFPNVLLRAKPYSRGYGAGANSGARLCHAPYVLVLNSDTEIPPGAIGALARYLDEHPSVGLVGPRLSNPDGSLQTSCFHFPTPFYMLTLESSLHNIAGKMPGLRNRYLPTSDHAHARPVPWVLGAALAMRRSVFDELGGFDEGFFMYNEEIDLAYRVWKAGWQVHFAPVTTILHVGGASTKLHRATMMAQLYRSRLRFYR
ncbi:MAG TPA: glycosyltransferase family 2 protein, partial [Roseiflexaceae bacterium]|nr:glycosyltransferase family 2 protein [Roseiflexaceae bacterium]